MEDIELVSKCKEGDRKAFSTLIKRYEKDLYRVAIAMTKNNDDALDCIQEAILQAFKNISSLLHEEYFKTWLIKILINKCNEMLYKKKRIILFSEYQSEDSYSYNTEAIEVNDAVNKLEESLKLLVILYYFEDMSIKDIAESLNIPEGTVKSRLARAREKLKLFLTVKESEVM